MKVVTHGNGNGLNDLYILPENDKERKHIPLIVKALGHECNLCYSDVKGQEWYHKWFIEVPFGECHLEDIKKALEEG